MIKIERDRTGKIIAMPSMNEDFGIRCANKRTHKRYLRQHHLGKFKKKQTK